jgi:soluble lytic murein transglycosylase-like protein
MGVTQNIGEVYGGISDVQELLIPETNIKSGSGYLAYLKGNFGNNPIWSESYNEGETNYRKGKHYNPSYSTNFNARVLALKGLG